MNLEPRSSQACLCATLLAAFLLLTPATHAQPSTVERYCRGNASIDTVSLYTEPPCDRTREQTPGFNASIPYQGVPVGNLSFCCKANYTALVPLGSDVSVLDAEARYMYSFVENFLTRYDCTNFYPFHTCDLCRDAYRTWVCSLVFPMKCLGARNAALQVCDDVCLEVQRKCPSEMEFFCPLDDNSDDKGDGKYGDWTGGTDSTLFGAGGCNPMNYNLGPGSQYGSAGAPLSSLAVAALVVAMALTAATA